MNKDSKIFVAGGRGMVGSAIIRKLKNEGFFNILSPSSKELDLRNQQEVNNFFEIEKPEFVFLSAAKVGGILANNNYPADFLYDNLIIECNTIHAAYESKVKKLLFLGSSCIYPKYAEQPIKESFLLTGSLEETNEAYAIAKIAGIELCKFYRKQYNCNFISAMPTNLYGPNDNYDLKNSHVIPALIKKIIDAKNTNQSTVEVWGTGTPLREFLHVDDLADACLFLMNSYSQEQHINVGSGQEISIADLVTLIQEIVEYKGSIIFDTTKPNGTPRKLLDNTLINNLGWKAKLTLREGLKKVIAEFI